MNDNVLRKLVSIAEVAIDGPIGDKAMIKLREIDPTYHWCPNWDYMVLCASDPEAEGCTCEITKGKGRRKL